MLAPKSVAFVGGAVAEMSIRRCLELGFEGQIWPVHPDRETVAGFRCYPGIDDLPGVPDAAYLGVRRELTIEIAGRFAAIGAGGCVCYAAGFAEMGDEGQELQRQLQQAAGDMPLVGPNCFGFVNYLDRCALWPYLFGGERVESGPALVSQSGNIGMNLTMNQRSVNFTYVIGAGNQAVLGPGHYIEALLLDERVTAIGMYIEGFDDVSHFSGAAALALEKGVPIVIVKAGRTETSARQTSSHTSALTGSDQLYDALFRRLGVVRVDSLNRLLETLKVLDRAGPLSGRKILTLSCSGGEAALVADKAPDYELDLPPFSDGQLAALNAQFPNYVTVSNPFDYNTSIWADRAALEQCFTTSMQGDHDAAILIYDHPTVEAEEVDEWIVALDAFIAAHMKTGMPAFVLCTVSELLPTELRDYMIANGVWPLQGMDDGLFGYSAAAGFYARRAQLANGVSLPRPMGSPCSGELTVLDEWESKTRLAAFGLIIPECGAGSAGDVPDLANRLGFPVAVKAVGKAFLHKSDLGAIVVNVCNEVEAKAAVNHIVHSCNEHGLRAERFLVEKMIGEPVAELIVGIKRDKQFGPALLIGAGGILVEMMADSRSLLFPVERSDVVNALESLAVTRLLNGYRGKPAADVDAAVDAIVAVVRFAEENWEVLQELDVNPLMVMPDGQGAVAADALLVFADR